MRLRKRTHNLTEGEIIELAKKDSNYFGILYDRYFEAIFRFCFKRLGGAEDESGDVAQMVFMKAMANLEKYEDRGLPFSSWLYRIAQNEVNMFFRKQSKQYNVAIDENRIADVAQEANIQSYMSMDDQEKLIELLNDLDEEHKDLIELRFFQEMSFKQIAEIYKISEANAKMRLYRILEKIQQKWNNKK